MPVRLSDNSRNGREIIKHLLRDAVDYSFICMRMRLRRNLAQSGRQSVQSVCCLCMESRFIMHILLGDGVQHIFVVVGMRRRTDWKQSLPDIMDIIIRGILKLL